MTGFVVRAASAEEFRTAVDWAAAEGWNPGLSDLEAMYASDPQGFMMGWLGNAPVSSIAVVRYGDDFGFLGFYIVAEGHRGKGFGLATWNAGMAHLAGRTIGLDGVAAQQDNYRKSGFELNGRNIRHSGNPKPLDAALPGVQVGTVDATLLDAAIAFDRRHFPADRSAFARRWFGVPQREDRHTLAVLQAGDIVGLGTIRRCRSGWKLGPLFARDRTIAAVLFDALCTRRADDGPVSLDTPDANPAAVALAAAAGLKPAFETARMYRGRVPDLALGEIYGITTFELG